MATKRNAELAATESVRTALAKHGFPSAGGPGLCFTPEGDALFSRGYPAMRFLSDEAVPAALALK